MKCPFNPEYLNIKYLYSLHSRRARGVGLGKALAQLGMDFEGRPHCGADDAWNAARVLKRILGWDDA